MTSLPPSHQQKRIDGHPCQVCPKLVSDLGRYIYGERDGRRKKKKCKLEVFTGVGMPNCRTPLKVETWERARVHDLRHRNGGWNDEAKLLQHSANTHWAL